MEGSLHIGISCYPVHPDRKTAVQGGRGLVRLGHCQCIVQKLLPRGASRDKGLPAQFTITAPPLQRPTLVVADLQSSNSQGSAHPVQISPSRTMPSSIALISRTHLSLVRGASRRMDVRSARCNEWKRERPRLAMHEHSGVFIMHLETDLPIVIHSLG